MKSLSMGHPLHAEILLFLDIKKNLTTLKRKKSARINQSVKGSEEARVRVSNND